MDELDALLARLARAPLPASLEEIEAKVFARIAIRPVGQVGVGISAMTVAVALAIGIIGAGIPARRAGAATLLSPLGPELALAPSTLLGSEP